MGSSSSRHSKTITKNEFLEAATHGDLMLFSGIGTDSDMIRCFSRNDKWSHVGIVIVRNGTKYVLESDRKERLDTFTNTVKNGVQLNLLESRISTYKGSSIALKKILYDKYKNPNLDYFLKTNLEKLLKEVTSYEYTKNLMELYRSTNDSNSTNGDDFFCTKLAAYMYMSWGIFMSDKLENNYSINDLAEENGTPLPFTRGFYFSESVVYNLN